MSITQKMSYGSIHNGKYAGKDCNRQFVLEPTNCISEIN